jgi:acyl carrier protein
VDKVIKDEVLEIIRDLCVEHGIEEIAEVDYELEKYGFNSISFITLMVKLEEKFNIEIDEDDLDYKKYKTVEDICQLIDSYSKD